MFTPAQTENQPLETTLQVEPALFYSLPIDFNLVRVFNFQFDMTLLVYQRRSEL